MPNSVWIKYAESLNCVFEKKILPLNFSKKASRANRKQHVSLIGKNQCPVPPECVATVFRINWKCLFNRI